VETLAPRKVNGDVDVTVAIWFCAQIAPAVTAARIVSLVAFFIWWLSS
jgi:hypothetical protein